MRFTPILAARALARPGEVFALIAAERPSAGRVFFGCALWLGLIPPVCAFVGAVVFGGWRLGAGEPLALSATAALVVSVAYYLALLCGFAFAAAIAGWMRQTYAASAPVGNCFALIAVAGAPLAIGGVVHLYPSLALNLAFLLPAAMWSAWLLYRGLPVALATDAERGMLMASAIVGALLTGAVALLAVTIVLWSVGLGPNLWI